MKTQKKIKRIGILTGGGDCPGLNAVIRAVTKSAIANHGWEVFGIEDGYAGLIEKRGHELTQAQVSGILTLGGTILGTSNRADPFRVPVEKSKKIVFEDHSDQTIEHFHQWGLDVLVAVGGDGTLSIGKRLYHKGIPVVGIPKTIDNDLRGTDYTFGFHTAVSIATEAVDRLHTTAAAHHRVMILEVMGRNAGWIALHAGSAGGADIILIPELPYSMDAISRAVKKRAQHGKKFSLIVVAEGAKEKGGKIIERKRDPKNPYPVKLGGVGKYLEEQIEKLTGLETRSANLGHIQRGGSPVPADRNLGTLFGTHAVELIARQRWGHMVCVQGNIIKSIPIAEAVHQLKIVTPDNPLVVASKAVGISFGV
ncbi:MAG TPA: ATP-dependent 6-phosphofructokinase [Candidatus Omnitrophota bacterium]|nr:ATP-dependent 6-phosphofructokinase [Candidatus Omnitrophota bacterium]HRY85391.1 ATP-dependent 6-phosphofructokinase [Candidatus Omnitrophota bacterium]